MGVLGCGGSGDTATRRGTGRGAKVTGRCVGGLSWDPERPWVTPAAGAAPGLHPTGVPRGGHGTHQHKTCSAARPTQTLPTAGWLKIAGTVFSELNITGIDRAAGPAAGRAGAEHGPAPAEAGSERGPGIHTGTAPLSAGVARVQLPVSGWGRIPPGNSPPPVPVFPGRLNAVWGAREAGRVPPPRSTGSGGCCITESDEYLWPFKNSCCIVLPPHVRSQRGAGKLLN